MTAKRLKAILNNVDDDAQIHIQISDEGYNLHTVEVSTFELLDDTLTLQGEE